MVNVSIIGFSHFTDVQENHVMYKQSTPYPEAIMKRQALVIQSPFESRLSICK